MTTSACNHVNLPNMEGYHHAPNRPEAVNARISVVIPTYRSRDSLPLLIPQLEAVLHSKGYDFEIIVVDDGSPDNSWEVLRTLKEGRSRLKIARLARNSGQHNAILCG